MNVSLSFVIPCFRSTPMLRDLILSLTELCSKEDFKFEIILVQDSRDSETTEVLSSIRKAPAPVRVVRLSKNYGQQAATVAGIVETHGDIIVTLDDDYQHLPKDAIAMVRQFQNDPDLDLLYARPLRPSDSRTRVRNGRIFRTLLRLSGLSFSDSVSSFRVFRGAYRAAFTSLPGPRVSVDVTLSWLVENVDTYKCQFRPRQSGSSGYSTRSLLRLAFTVLVSYTVRPLVAGLYAGFFGILLSLGFGIFILWSYFFGATTLPGFATTTLLILFLGSTQMVMLGILGMYVGEQHRRSIAEPAFFVIGKD